MPRTPAVRPADPLADLRAPEDPGTVPAALTEQPVIATVPENPARAAMAPEPPDEDQQVHLIVSRWHADATAQSFGHSGGTCGCAYLARAAVRALRA